MADDLFKDCECPDCGDCECPDCGDCDCDCDCFDCDCNCDNCLPGDNVIICCCFPTPAVRNDDARRTRDASPDCCCCCDRRRSSPRRRKRSRRNSRNKKGFCCWRKWWCCGGNEPSPPPSPPRRGPDSRDGRYPMPDDMDFYMNDRWDRHHELMPPIGYKSGGRNPMHEEMRMYRDEYDARGGKWSDSREARKGYGSGGRYGSREEERDVRSTDHYYRHDRYEREARGKASRDLKDDRKKPGVNELGASSVDSSSKREDLGKASKDEEKSTSVVQDVPPAYVPHRQDKPDEMEISSFGSYAFGRYDSSTSQGGLDNPHH